MEKEETMTQKAINHIKEHGSANLEDICILLRRSKNNVRSLLSKQVSSKTLFVKNIDGINSMYSDVPFSELEKNNLLEDGETLVAPKKEPTCELPPKTEKVDFDLPDPSELSNPKGDVPKGAEDIILPPEDTTDKVFISINGLGTVSEEKLSEWFAEGILTVDVDKLIAKMKVSTLAIEKDKIIFGV